MRVRAVHIKNNAQQASKIEEFLRTQVGVTAASANTVTGSVVVHYEIDQTGAEAILEQLGSAGYKVIEALDSRNRTSLPSLDSIGVRVRDSLLEKIVERSAIALITAFI